MQSGATTLKDNSAVFCKDKYPFAYDLLITFLGIYLNEFKLISIENLHTGVYSSLFLVVRT
jgi:hypothetical protein